MLSKARMRGIVGGAAVLTLFGAFWCIEALAFWPKRPGWGIPVATGATIILLIVCALRWTASAKLPASHDAAAAAEGKRSGILLGIVFGIEGGLIGLTSALLGRSGFGDWIPVAIALIVGVHFLPLARVFKVPLYYWTGGLAVFGTLGCLLAHPVGPRLLCVGLLMAVVLWSTTILLLVQPRSIQAWTGHVP